MGCSICGRGSCTSSFHSIEEQERHNRYYGKSVEELRSECIDKDDMIEALEERLVTLYKLEAAGVDNWEGYEDAMGQEGF